MISRALKLTVALLCAFMVAFSEQSDMVDVVKGNTTLDEAVYYKIIFVNTWTEEDHPVMYPQGAQWSPPVFASHVMQYQMFGKGKRPSIELKEVALFGNETSLLSKLKELKDRDRPAVGAYVEGSPQTQKSQTIGDSLKVTKRNRFISMVSKMSPSPDWFSGFNSIRPFSNLQWHDKFTVLLRPLDAGTDSGDTYLAKRSRTRPSQPVARFTPRTAPNGVFVKDDKIAPVGAVVFVRVGGP